MKMVYPIVMTNGDSHTVVFIPDFNINTQGENYADAMAMARDAIGLVGIDLQDDGEEIPVPSSIDFVRSQYADALVSLVDIDFDEYRRKNDLRTVRRNVSLPSWLNVEAEKAGINVSAVLQTALKKELHIESK